MCPSESQLHHCEAYFRRDENDSSGWQLTRQFHLLLPRSLNPWPADFEVACFRLGGQRSELFFARSGLSRLTVSRRRTRHCLKRTPAANG